MLVWFVKIFDRLDLPSTYTYEQLPKTCLVSTVVTDTFDYIQLCHFFFK